mgnify:CR=1 FL=1
MPTTNTRSARKPPRRTRGKPTAVDVHVGQRIRLRRTLLGISQETLARALDLTFQQVQKYERGSNRVGAGRLYQLSQALDVPVSYFFAGLTEVRGPSADDLTAEPDLLSRRESLALVQAYYGIADPGVRRRVLALLRAVGAGSAVPAEDGPE